MMDILIVVSLTTSIFLFWGLVMAGLTGALTRDVRVMTDNFQGAAGIAMLVPAMALIGWLASLVR